MNNQLDKSRFDGRIGVTSLVIGALLLAAAGCGGSDGETAGIDEASGEEAHVIVRVQPAQLRAIATTISALGRCEAPPEKLAMLTPLVEGQVSTILAEQGRQVKSGQGVVQLDGALAQADLAEKQAARDSLTAALNFLVSTPRVEEQQASKLAIEQANIAIARAEALVVRLRPLRARGEVPEQQMFEAEQALKQAQVQQRTALAQYDVLMLRPREEAIAEAQSKIAVADEAVKAAQTRLEYFTIRTPIDGVLNSMTCRPGETIAIGASIGEVVDSRQVLVKAWLPVQSRMSVHEGQTAHIRLPRARSTDASEALPPIVDGQLVFVGSVVDPQTGNVPVDIAVENAQNGLVIGETLYVEIVVDQPAESLAVPANAAHDEGEGEVITVVREGRAFVLHPQFGASDGRWTAVTGSDLKVGEPVIVEGAYNLPDGAPVQVPTSGDGASPDQS
jgi:RND family efflux transporter MFP subunit